MSPGAPATCPASCNGGDQTAALVSFSFLFFYFFVSLQQPSIKANDKEPLGLDLLKERRNNGVAERISHILVWGFGALLAPADWTLDLAVRDSFAGEKKRRERG